MKNISKIVLIVTFSLIAFCSFIFNSFAQIPRLINYQAKLTDPSGSPVSDGIHSITFRIYDAADGGNLLWEEIQNILIQKGIFACLLGGVNDLNIPFDKPYWLAIKVGSDPEMSPRQQIAASGYAIRAEHAVTAGNAQEAAHAADADHANQADNANTVGGLNVSEIGPISNFVVSSYTGDGAANRIINLGFTPDYVFVSGADGKHRFYGMGSSYWQAGHDYNWNKNDTRWKGITANGFQSGSNPGCDRNANKSGRVFNYIAIKQK